MGIVLAFGLQTAIHIYQFPRGDTTMAKFNYNDIVRVRPASSNSLPSDRAWIVGVFEHPHGTYFEKFAEGTVYTVEFEDGSSDEFHEADLEPAESPVTDANPVIRKRAG